MIERIPVNKFAVWLDVREDTNGWTATYWVGDAKTPDDEALASFWRDALVLEVVRPYGSENAARREAMRAAIAAM